MSNLYAQIIRGNNKVVLIGDERIGLPIENHPLAYCVDITGRTDVEIGMSYNEETKQFHNPERENQETPAPKVETSEEKLDRLEKQIQEDNLLTYDVLATIYEELLTLKAQLGG